MPRNCDCAGGCGPAGDWTNLIPLAAVEEMSAEQAEAELAAWKKSLHQPAKPRTYSSDKHTDARMPLGGIGTGCFEIGADGRFTTWQLFNTLRDGYVPFFFAVRAGGKAKLLQTTGGPNFPKIARIEMQGDYPIATLKFIDREIPVRIEMQAFSPLAPLDSQISSLPVACFVFKIHNPTKQKQTVSLAALIQIQSATMRWASGARSTIWGFNAVGERLGNRHPNFGSNTVGTVSYATEHAKEKAEAIILSAVKAQIRSSSSPRVCSRTRIQRAQRTVSSRRSYRAPLEKMSGSEPGAARRGDRALHDAPGRPQEIIWILDPAADLDPSILRKAHELVEAATLVLSGRQSPLLNEYGRLTQGKPLDRANFRPDILFEDFESGYEKWWTTGTAFGMLPCTGRYLNSAVGYRIPGEGAGQFVRARR